MSLTIIINGLTLAHKGSAGTATATIPDVCKTPPIPTPVPYPNISFSHFLAKGTTTVKADGGNMIAIKGSELSMSTGDEPGVAGGIKSSTFIQEATWITYSLDVKMNGKNACRLTDKLWMNHMNAACLAGFIQRFLSRNPGSSIDDACDALFERIEDLVGQGRTGKKNGIRGLEERFQQNTSGGTHGAHGAPNAPADRPDGTNSWQRHDEEIGRQQKDLDNKINEYDDKCRPPGPPIPVPIREWVRKPRPVPNDWTGPKWVPTSRTVETGSRGIGERIGWGILGGLAVVGAAAMFVVPFDGPAGELVLGAGAAAAFGMAFGTETGGGIPDA